MVPEDISELALEDRPSLGFVQKISRGGGIRIGGWYLAHLFHMENAGDELFVFEIQSEIALVRVIAVEGDSGFGKQIRECFVLGIKGQN
jgi:hypothetical protein